MAAAVVAAPVTTAVAEVGVVEGAEEDALAVVGPVAAAAITTGAALAAAEAAAAAIAAAFSCGVLSSDGFSYVLTRVMEL